jgi:hypothetical protein
MIRNVRKCRTCGDTARFGHSHPHDYMPRHGEAGNGEPCTACNKPRGRHPEPEYVWVEVEA